MAAKPIPEYMKRFMENIGHECFTDYQNLSRQYHDTVQVYHELKAPHRIQVGGRLSPQRDLQADLYRLENDFKGRALELACEKYGYNDPGYRDFDSGLTDRQEAGEYNNVVKEDFGLSQEDMRARKAHNSYEAKHPEKVAERQSNREVIELYFDGKDGTMQPSRDSPVKDAELKAPEKEQKKEPFSRGELFKAYTADKENMTEAKNKFSMSDRFFMSLSSERQARDSMDAPGKNEMSKDKDDLEIERDL